MNARNKFKNNISYDKKNFSKTFASGGFKKNKITSHNNNTNSSNLNKSDKKKNLIFSNIDKNKEKSNLKNKNLKLSPNKLKISKNYNNNNNNILENINKEDNNSTNNNNNNNNNNNLIDDKLNKSLNKTRSIKEEIIYFPSKTAQTGINFMTKEKENIFLNDETDVSKQVYESLYILNDIKYEKKSSKELLENLYKLTNCNNMKSLFQNLYQKIYVNKDIKEETFNKFKKFINKNKEEFILISKMLNQPLCWVVFNLFEFEKYLNIIFNKDK